ncbi:hypothetical protein KEM55_007437 [Ascosphaera atra]|nr:hypothetical protein KEM55_007437 [Ascosphaera atra]
MSAQHVSRASPSAVPNTDAPVARPSAANPDHRPRHRPIVDERQIVVDTVEDGVTGNHWVANLAYTPLRELLDGLGNRPLIHHVDFA